MTANRRILLGAINLVLIFFAPYWIYLPVLFFSSILTSFYWEGVIFGVLIDILYGKDGSFLSSHAFGILFLLIVAISGPLKSRFRFNASR